MKKIDYDSALLDIQRDGFSIIRGVFTREEVEEYRKECAHEFTIAPQLEGKVYVPGKTPNYVQPWMIDTANHQVASYRLYQFFHNHISPTAKKLIDATIAVRSHLEKNWPEIAEYNAKNNLVDYNIVAKYSAESGYQSRHTDMEADLAYPALQCELLLTEPYKDYNGGDLVLHLLDGRRISVNDDAKATVGDIILFDKRIEHEVTATKPALGGRGRWMALIGAKTFPRKKRKLSQDLRIKISRYLFLKAPKMYTSLKRLTRREQQKNSTPFSTYQK